MYEYGLHQAVSAELIRRADAERQARHVRLARRADRRLSGSDDPGGRVRRGRGRFLLHVAAWR
ncbi:hypothetical protein [Streptomyces sp. cmx-18-6]|uniref:hypothetical protein n=1 Tax=Streptomyces sp. cmx-18-6 TaxID=2790930 RepID=UPI00397FC19C